MSMENQQDPEREQAIKTAYEYITNTIDDGDALTGHADEVRNILRAIWDRACQHMADEYLPEPDEGQYDVIPEAVEDNYDDTFEEPMHMQENEDRYDRSDDE